MNGMRVFRAQAAAPAHPGAHQRWRGPVMNRWLVGLIAACLAASSSFGGETGNPAATSSDDEQQLFKLERDWIAAEINRDPATLRRLLDDRFLATFGAGKSVDKEGFIKVVLGDGADKTLSQDLTEQTVLVVQDTAVIFETDTVRGVDHDKPYTLVLRISTTYIKRHGRWLALAEHIAKEREGAELQANAAATRQGRTATALK